jgi:tol-pal system protein YbgF
MAPRRAIVPIALLACVFVLSPARAGEGDFSSRLQRLKDGAGRAVAQLYGARPPADLDDEAPPPGAARDAAGQGLRMDRLERDMRQMTGRIEEMQHEIQRLEEQLRAARGAPGAAAAAPASPPVAGAPAAPAPAQTPLRRGDAFDPAAHPAAPGAPQPLGAAAPSAPLAPGARPVVTTRETGQPLDLTHGHGADPAVGATASIGATEPAAAPPAGPREDYDKSLGLLRGGQYEAAEKGFAEFLTKNPKNKLSAGATFNLGESYFLRGRHREAAEKYLEISTKYAQSALAPEAMLRLGQSLNAMGAKEQACASFNEIGVKYPSAAPKLRDAADREAKKLQC